MKRPRHVQPDRWGPFLFGCVLLMVLLTALNFLVLDRYQPAGEAVHVLPPEGLTVENRDRQKIVRHDIPVRLADPRGFVKIEAVAEGFDIRAGERPWQRGRIVFLRQSLKGDHYWDIPHVVALLKDNPVRWRFTQVFGGDSRAAYLSMRIELLKASGLLKVYSLTATPMREAHGFRAVANGLTAAWLILGLAVSFWCWRRAWHGRWLIGLAWLVAAPALVLSVLPAKATNPARMVAVEAIDLVASDHASEKEKEAAVSANSFSIAKSGHVIMFMCVGFFIMLARGRSAFAAILLLAAGYAGLCEMLQLFSPNRAPAGLDLLLNMVSACVGAVLAGLLLFLPPVGRLAGKA